MRQIRVKLAGSKTEPFTTQVTPGDTASEVLSRINLADYVLAIPPAPNRYFAPDESVYEELMEGDYLLAVAPPTPSVAPLKPVAAHDTGAAAGKRLTISLYGSKRPLIHIQLRPGTTVAMVLASLHTLSDYILVPAWSAVEDIPTTIFKKRFSPEDDLNERTQDGDTLIAIPASAAARLAFAVMMQKHTAKEIML